MYIQRDRNYVGKYEREVRAALKGQHGLTWSASENGLRMLDVEPDHAPNSVCQGAHSCHREHGVGPHRSREDRYDDEETAAKD